jgi:hypothetical protein
MRVVSPIRNCTETALPFVYHLTTWAPWCCNRCISYVSRVALRKGLVRTGVGSALICRPWGPAYTQAPVITICTNCVPALYLYEVNEIYFLCRIDWRTLECDLIRKLGEYTGLQPPVSKALDPLSPRCQVSPAAVSRQVSMLTKCLFASLPRFQVCCQQSRGTVRRRIIDRRWLAISSAQARAEIACSYLGTQQEVAHRFDDHNAIRA